MKQRISAFAILVPSAILLLVAGGLFFRARAQNERERRLESVQRMLEQTLVPGLKIRPDVISMKEFDLLTSLRRHGVTRLLYLNAKAEHRFFHDNNSPAKMCFDCVQEVTPYSTEVLDAVETGWETHSPTAIRFNAHETDIIIPIASKERPLGMVLLRASDSALASLPEVLISASIDPKQLKETDTNRGDTKQASMSAREYRRIAESMFSR